MDKHDGRRSVGPELKGFDRPKVEDSKTEED